ncbi:lytic transglycosylase [Croceicoccus estronivorus]|uniref:lytic murein transglycosylase n=1 Tax=Croceicoccus estronivorus TaxID=1172626 RepID=UPI00082D6F4A|nr:lytic transglycosylase [Croceicoccus estronivorus]
MKLTVRIATLLASFALCAPIASASAQAPVDMAPNMSFDSYLQLLIAKARGEGVSEATITRMTADLTANSRVIALDQDQPGTPTRSGYPAMAPYIARHVDAARINGGRRVMASVPGMAARIENEYGVPIEVVVAIFGHETNYGSYTGDFDLARSLATLAWEGRRRDFFAQEFVDLLKIADTGVQRYQLKGSWAGAFGYPQFMPSIYLRLAKDGDGDGVANIWSSRADALASIANYFHDAGWRSGQPWGVRVAVPGAFDRSAVASSLESPVCPRVHERHSVWKTVREWRNLGFQPLAPIRDDVMASFFEPDGPGAPAYLLTGNYRVITEYNCSNYYALSVGLLADEIAH